MLDHLRKYQQILFDLTANYLEPLNGAYQRLAFLFSLRDASTGKYVHETFVNLYGSAAVDRRSSRMPRGVFRTLLLEMPLNAQKADLQMYLASLTGTLRGMSCVAAKLVRSGSRLGLPATSQSFTVPIWPSFWNC